MNQKDKFYSFWMGETQTKWEITYVLDMYREVGIKMIGIHPIHGIVCVVKSGLKL